MPQLNQHNYGAFEKNREASTSDELDGLLSDDLSYQYGDRTLAKGQDVPSKTTSLHGLSWIGGGFVIAAFFVLLLKF